jgi:molybdopterin converting factor small subunit
MAIRVLFFASYADLTGRAVAEVPTAGIRTVAEVIAVLRQTVPGADRLPPRPLVAVNQRHAALDSAVSDHDEIALLPPLAGG